ncbi:hypothetical protein ACFX2F_021833 [Malus domestica]
MAKAEPDAFVSPTDLAPQLLTTNPISAPTLTWSPTVGVGTCTPELRPWPTPTLSSKRLNSRGWSSPTRPWS